MIDIFNNFYRGKRVLITGHTGFKGSWLSIWLHELGAEVIGIAQDPFTERDNYVLSGIGKKIKADIRADIRDGNKMKEIFAEYRPEIVFHLAAQPLVRLSYDIPVETYEVNVMGTINIMEAIRATSSVKVGVMITTTNSLTVMSRPTPSEVTIHTPHQKEHARLPFHHGAVRSSTLPTTVPNTPFRSQAYVPAMS